MADQEDPISRLTERDWSIWRKWTRGKSQTDLAREYGIGQQRVSQIVQRVRESIPQETRDDLVRRELAMWNDLRAEILEEIYGAAPTPVTAGKDGAPVVDPETGRFVRDHSGRLAGAKMALNISESLRRMVGADAAQKVDVNLGEEAATQEGAAEARAFLDRHTELEEAE